GAPPWARSPGSRSPLPATAPPSRATHSRRPPPLTATATLSQYSRASSADSGGRKPTEPPSCTTGPGSPIRGGCSRRAASASRASITGIGRRLGLELLVQDLGDEAVERDRVEAHVGGQDHPGVDDLSLRQLVQRALHLGLRVAVPALDLEVLPLERHLVAIGVGEGEDARDQRLVHQLVLLEEIAVGVSRAARRG